MSQLRGETDSSAAPRAMCSGCGRPRVVCLGPALRRLSTRTRVAILQHPRERDVPINTARLVELQLEQAEVQQGLVQARRSGDSHRARILTQLAIAMRNGDRESVTRLKESLASETSNGKQVD